MSEEERNSTGRYFATKGVVCRKLTALGMPFVVFITALATAGVIFGGLRFYNWLTADHTVIGNDSIREEVRNTEILQPSEYNFTQILYLSDSGNPFNWNNPITSKLYIATIDGSIPILCDLSQVEPEVTRDLDDKPTEVKLSVPYCYVGEVALDEATVKKYVEQNGALNINPVTADDVTNLRKQAQGEQVAKLRASGYLETADAHVEELLASRVKSLCGANVKVSFTRTGESESTYGMEAQTAGAQ
ncbi:DUF4230 domain-containing protein [Paratractidigestivibacter sp.]|uniref:DUF4230 domain-containing protein n=1 Tax=Paratractidigestivibacter sp. TaxID=2847316 RepID=UPI002ABD9902|nr:DUF4230 domain-containing protein [Paratractidigestivibacter sp.]